MVNPGNTFMTQRSFQMALPQTKLPQAIKYVNIDHIQLSYIKLYRIPQAGLHKLRETRPEAAERPGALHRITSNDCIHQIFTTELHQVIYRAPCTEYIQLSYIELYQIPQARWPGSRWASTRRCAPQVFGTTQTHPTPTTPYLTNVYHCVNHIKGHI